MNKSGKDPLDLVAIERPVPDGMIKRFSPDEFQPNDAPQCIDAEETWNKGQPLQAQQGGSFEIELPSNGAQDAMADASLPLVGRPFLDADDFIAEYDEERPMMPGNFLRAAIEERCVTRIAGEQESVLIDFAKRPVLRLPKGKGGNFERWQPIRAR